MISGGVDTFDLQLINGCNRTDFYGAKNGVTVDSGNPYVNGVAGSTSVQTGNSIYA